MLLGPNMAAAMARCVGAGGSTSQPMLRVSFLELDVPYGA